MLIGIDARSLEGNRTGVGRYLLNLLKEWVKNCHCEFREAERSNPVCVPPEASARRVDGDKRAGFLATLGMTEGLKFVLYFKDEIPVDLPRADFFEFKLLNVASNAKFVHWNLPKAAKKDKIDILFCPEYVAPLCYKGKIALTLHDIVYEAHPEWFSWKSPADKILLKWVSKKSAQKAAVIFTISEFSRQEIIEYFKIDSKKIILAYLGVDPEFSASGFAENDLKEIKNKYGLEKFILSVGSIFDRRHLPEIIESFARGAAGNNWRFLIVGQDRTFKKNIDKLIKEKNSALGREAILRVDFASDSDLKSLYNACAFFIYLSDYEGFGLPPLEAMACGAPVITSAAASLKEVVGGASIMIRDNSNVEEIGLAMGKLMKDDNLRKELSEKGKIRSAELSWKECAEKTLEGLRKASER